MHEELISLIRDIYKTHEPIGIHMPCLTETVVDEISSVIYSGMVATNGSKVDEFEKLLSDYIGGQDVIATVNGTSALFLTLYALGVQPNDLVITQSLSFVATANVIKQIGADPVFLDISREDWCLSPESLRNFLEQETHIIRDECVHKNTGRRVKAILPVHNLGLPGDISTIKAIAADWQLNVIEDAAEGLGSKYQGKHIGTEGDLGILSFNGNKLLTTGGGGAVISKPGLISERIKRLSTTAKQPHPYEYHHSEPAFNLRMPAVNAAMGVAQMTYLDEMILAKRQLSEAYQEFFDGSEYQIITEPEGTVSNYWLNAVLCPSVKDRTDLLEETIEKGIQTRAIWQPLHFMPMFSKCIKGNLSVTEELSPRTVCLPSSVPPIHPN